MILGKDKYEVIVVTNKDDEIVAMIDDTDGKLQVIGYQDYKVVLIDEEENFKCVCKNGKINIKTDNKYTS